MNSEGQRVIEEAVGFWQSTEAITWSLKDMTRFDTRPRIVFLRPFREDKLRRPAQWPRAKLLTVGPPAVTLEEVLLEQRLPYGAVVGLGSEKDKFPPYGAAWLL